MELGFAGEDPEQAAPGPERAACLVPELFARNLRQPFDTTDVRVLIEQRRKIFVKPGDPADSYEASKR